MKLETTDYSIFKKLQCNREICPHNLKKIITSIQYRNLLSMRPIMVNSEMEVIDGQHRLEAAKHLEIPIFYVIEEKAIEEDIILLNNNQKKWKHKDYLNYFSEKNESHYCALKNYLYDNKIEIQTFFCLMNNQNGDMQENFRRGTFKMPENIYEINRRLLILKCVKDYLNKKLMGKLNYLHSQNFDRGLVRLIVLKDFVLEIFNKKLEIQLDKVHNCHNPNAYYELFKNIYNFKNSYPIGKS